MDLVSVIVPMFNDGKYIAETLASIINQTYPNLEVICVNDQSTDDTIAIVEAYQAKDKRIKLFHLPTKGGASLARNLALKKAK